VSNSDTDNRPEYACDQCGSTVLIAEYFNTQMDVLTTLDVMSARWVEDHIDAVKRLECLRCDNILIYDE
jgi:ribosomal protein S27AE